MSSPTITQPPVSKRRSTRKPPAAAVTRRFYNEFEVSEILGIPVSTLRRWRFDGRGPKFTRIEGCVKYSVTDLNEYIASCPTRGGNAA